MGWTGDVTTETLMEEAGEYCGDISGVALDLKRKWGVKCASTHELVTKNALLRVMSMAEWQDEEGEEDAKSKDWSTAANEKRGFEHPMASAAISLFNSTVLDKNGGEAWAEQGGGGWNDDFIGQQPTERLLGIQLDSQAILMLLLPLKASDPVLYRSVIGHDLLSGRLSNGGGALRSEKCKDVKNDNNWDRPVVSSSPKNSSEIVASDDLSPCRLGTSLLHSESKSSKLKSGEEERRENRPDTGTRTTTIPQNSSTSSEFLPPSEQKRNAAILTAQAAVDGGPECILLAVKILICSFIEIKEGGYEKSYYSEGVCQLPLGAIVGLLLDAGALRETNLFAKFVRSAVCKVKGTSPASNAELERSIDLPPLEVGESNTEFKLEKGDLGVYASSDEGGDSTSISAPGEVVPFPGVGGGVTTSTLHELEQISSRFRQLYQRQRESPISSLGSSSMALENLDIFEPGGSYNGVGINPIPTSSGAGIERTKYRNSRSSLTSKNAAARPAAEAVFRLFEFMAFAGKQGEGGNMGLELEDAFDLDKLAIEEMSPNAESISNPVNSIHSDSDSDCDPSATLGLVSIESIVLALLADLETRCYDLDANPTAAIEHFIHPDSLSIMLLFSLLSQLLSLHKNLKLKMETMHDSLPQTDSWGDNAYSNTKTPRGRYVHMLWRRRLFLASSMVSTLRMLDVTLRGASCHSPTGSEHNTSATIVADNVNQALLEDCVSFCCPNALDSVDTAPDDLRSLSDACRAKMGLCRSSALSAWAAASSLVCLTHELRVSFLRRLLLEVVKDGNDNSDVYSLSSRISEKPCAYLGAMCRRMSNPQELKAFAHSLSIFISQKHAVYDVTACPEIPSESSSRSPNFFGGVTSGTKSKMESTAFSEELMEMPPQQKEGPYSLPGGGGRGGAANSIPFPTDGKGMLYLMKVLLNRTFDFSLTAPTPLLSPSGEAELHLLLKLIHVLGDQLVKCSSNGPDGEGPDAAPVLDLSPSRKSSNIRISEDGQTATQVQGKSWGSIMTKQGFLPHSGIHQWLVHLRNCEKGHVFLGVATAAASVNTYVGGDQYGWGLIGTRVMWHGRSKVRSNLGGGFMTGNVVLLTLDTDRGTLTYTSQGSGSGVREQHYSNHSSNNEWQVVFNDLPTKETLFPAIGLYQLNDEVTISPVDPLLGSIFGGQYYPSTSLLTICQQPSSLPIFNAYTIILDFILDLLSLAQNLLSNIFEELVAEKIDVESASARVHSCSLLVHGLPSICASLVVARRIPFVATLLAVRLLPNVTSLIRTFDKYLAFLGRREGGGTACDHLLRANPHGTWRICSSDSEFTPDVEYTAEFYTDLNPQSGEYHLVGTSKGDSKKRSQAAAVEGRALGLHIAFVERWKMEETCAVEGRLSLDGSAFWGTYRSLRSGVGGNITGHRICNPYSEEGDAASLLLSFSVRASVIVSMLAGRLACSLVLGVEAAEPAEKIPPTKAMQAICVAGGGFSLDESSLSVLPPRRVEQIEVWQKSELLKGGLMIEEVAPRIAVALRLYLPPTSAISDDMNCWISSVFPVRFISSRASTRDSTTCFEQQYDAIGEVEVYVDDLLTGSGDSLALDAWESRIELRSPLTQLGGRVMFNAQRWIIAAIATHVGLLPVSRKTFLRSKERLVSKQQQPSHILIEVLRMTRQVMESSVRRCKTDLSGYLETSNLLICKAAFLLSVRPNQDAAAALGLFEEDQDPSSAGGGNGGRTTASSHLCTATGQFFQSTFGHVELKALYMSMVQSSVVAVFRAAGFSALKLLLNGYGGRGEEVQQQQQQQSIPPLHVSFLVSAALQYLLPALQGQVPMLVPQICSQYQLGLESARCAALASYAVAASSKGCRTAHYLDGIIGANQEAVESVASAFVGLYEFLAEQLRTAATTHNGAALLALLPAWRLNFTSKDHEFLVRVGIFELLLLAIDCARMETGPETEELLSSMWNSVKHSTLQVVELLASSICSLSNDVGVDSYKCGDERRREETADSISRREFQGVGAAVSEPSTLIGSLFDVLLFELRIVIEKMGEGNSQAGPSEVAKTSSSEQSSSSSLFLLSTEEMRGMFHANRYCYFLLGLVHHLYTSLKSCTKCLTSQKWLNVLFRSIVVGPPAVQRRTLRLLCKLLPSVSPSSAQLDIILKTAMGSTECTAELLLFCLGGNFVPLSAVHLFYSMKLGHSTANSTLATSYLATRYQANTSQQQLLSADDVSNSNPGRNIKQHEINLPNAVQSLPPPSGGGISNPISDEIVALLRCLLKEPPWKDYMSCKIVNALDGCNELLFGSGDVNQCHYDTDEIKNYDDEWFYRIVRPAAAASVLGGFIQSIHLGSSVALRHVSPQRGVPESLMTQLKDPSKPALLLTSLSVQSNTAQVVLPKCKGGGTGNNLNVQQRNWNGKNVGLSDSNSAVHVTGGGGGALHVFKLDCDELSAVPLVKETVDSSTTSSIAMAEKLFNVFLNQALPWVVSGRLSAAVNERKENDSSTVERLTAHNQSPGAGDDDRAAERRCDPTNPTLTSAPLEHQEEEVSRAERSALQSLLVVQIFKASATLLADEEFSRVLLRSKPNLMALFEVAVGDTENGLLQQLEHHEELWNAAWDKWNSRLRRWNAALSVAAAAVPPQAIDGGTPTVCTTTAAERAIPFSPDPSTAEAENANDLSVDSSSNHESSVDDRSRQQYSASGDSLSSGSQHNLSSLASYVTGTAMALGMGTIVMDTGAAVAQMVEMGFPENWSRTALARCGNSLEQAVAFCFENNASMDNIVAEEDVEAAVRVPIPLASLLGDDEPEERGWGGGGGGHRGGGDGGSSEQEALGLATPGSSSPTLESMLFMKQLLEMGFPRACCAKALTLNSNNVDSALTWILNNGEALAECGLDEECDPKAEGKKMRPISDSTAVSINPLQVISGAAHISADLCIEGVARRGFASVGARGCLITSGKWYYEALLVTAGCIQIGWADAAFQGDADNGDGVGDGPHSWAFDGWRECKWHGLDVRWGAAWKVGDVVGCMVDFDERKLSFALNGFNEEIGMGVAFDSFTCTGGLYPCASFNRDERLQFNFGEVPFVHSLPPGYQPYIKLIRERISRFSLIIIGALNDFLREDSSTKGEEEARGAAERTLLGHHQAILEDCLEEEAGLKAYACHAHYFAVDPGAKSRMSGGGGGAGSLPHIFSTTAPASSDALWDSSLLSGDDAGCFLPLSEVEAMAADVKALASASRTLCTLYARQASLMLLVNCSSDVIQDLVIDGRGEEGKRSRSEGLITKLLLLSTAEVSAETTTTTMRAAAAAAVCDNGKALLPSDVLAGGVRAQNALSCVVRDMLAMDHHLSTLSGDPFSCSALIVCVAEQIVKACNRRYANHFVYPVIAGGIHNISELPFSSRSSSTRKLFRSRRSPVNSTSKYPNWATRRRMAVAHGGGLMTPILDGNIVSRPNVGLALWISSIILAQLSNNRSSHYSRGEVEENVTSSFSSATTSICYSWSLSFFSPNVSLKLLASVVISGILQDLSSLLLALPKQSSSQSEDLLNALDTCLTYIPTSRLYKALLARLWAERTSTPMFSRYLQGLVEINASIHIARILRKDKCDDLGLTPHNEIEWMLPPPSIPKRLDPPSFPLRDWKRYCHEWDEGFVLSSEGWLLWSGRVTQKPVHWDRCIRPPRCKTITNSSPAIVDITHPPLVPGCFVLKKEDWKDEYVGKCPHLSSHDYFVTPAATTTADVSDRGTNHEEGVRHSEGGDASDEDEEYCSQSSSSAAATLDIDRLVSHPSSENNNSSSPRDETSPSHNKDENSGSDNDPTSPSCLVVVGSVVEIVPLGGLPGGGRRVKWQDGSEGIYKWGAEGCIDLIHIQFGSDGRIERSFPPPELPEDRAAWSGFGAKPSWGVVLRIRPGPRFENQNENISTSNTTRTVPFTGVLEWPDFSAAVAVEGEMSADGSGLTFSEKELVYGNPHMGWESRFAMPGYISGTSYNLRSTIGGGKNFPPSSLNGISRGIARLPGSCTDVTYDVTLSNEDLFSFDVSTCHSSISVSSDGHLATCTGCDRGMVYGTVGFSWGVHYWEIKVVEGEPGCIFLGVAEKSAPTQHMTEWHGMGFVNYRATYCNGVERVYGEHFSSGDTVGIRLDMDRGVLGFYLDGMKYGEHVALDLGVAFEGLLGSTPRVSPRTMFPVVGLNNCGDRVALSTKWLSTPGCHPATLWDNAMATARLLKCWDADSEIDTTTTTPVLTTTVPLKCMRQFPRWFRVEAWQFWLRWRSGRWRRVGTRVQNGPRVDLDMSPRACAKASFLLGLGTLLFSGDVVRVMHSCGRPLEQPESCVVLGALGNKLFYRLESQKSDNAFTSDGSLASAWCWTPHDLPSMGAITVLRRGDGVPDSVCALTLPRLRMHCGGWLCVVSEEGAAIRNGVTEQSLELGVIPYGAVFLAASCHECSFGTRQFFICYEGIHGWVCEKMCSGVSGVEETVLRRMTDEEARNSGHNLDDDVSATVGEGESVFEDAYDAVEEWVRMVKELGCAAVKWLNMCNHPDNSLESFESACCRDNVWSLGVDFSIVHLLNEVASCCATDPVNVPFARLESAFVAVRGSFTSGGGPQRLQDPLERTIHSVIFAEVEEEGSSGSSSLARLAPDLVLARMAVLLTLNLRVVRALPFFSLSLPEKEWENNVNNTMEPRGWKPVCIARKLRDLRRILFTATKQVFWDSLIDASTTPTPLNHDEYEDPREIRVIKVNRVKAAPSRLCSISNPFERLKQSVFGQLHKEMRGWPASTFRRAHVGKGHGGQRRAFKVKFLGEGVDDYGGPYRAIFEQVADELQKDNLTLKSGQPVEDGCLLPLLVPSPNRVARVGREQGKFLLAPSPMVGNAIFSAGVLEELACFLGKLLGVAVRHGLQMGLDLTPLVWNPLVELPVGPEIIEGVDHITHRFLQDVESVGAALESGEMNTFPKEWDHVTMSAHLSNNHEVPLVPFGHNIPLSRDNWREYVKRLGHLRLTESSTTLQAFRDGLATVLPVGIFPLFTAEELESLICGVQNIDVSLLRSCTEYDGVSPDDEHVLAFWEVLEEMQPAELAAFLRFVWARSRMPSSAKDFPMWFKIQAPQGGAKDSPDEYLPCAQTCFFSLSLPFYTSKQILREKLLYAIATSPNMDADVRLNSTEGAWG